MNVGLWPVTPEAIKFVAVIYKLSLTAAVIYKPSLTCRHLHADLSGTRFLLRDSFLSLAL